MRNAPEGEWERKEGASEREQEKGAAGIDGIVWERPGDDKNVNAMRESVTRKAGAEALEEHGERERDRERGGGGVVRVAFGY